MRCKLKIDKTDYSKSYSIEQRITLPKMSLQCILKKQKCFSIIIHFILSKDAAEAP